MRIVKFRQQWVICSLLSLAKEVERVIYIRAANKDKRAFLLPRPRTLKDWLTLNHNINLIHLMQLRQIPSKYIRQFLLVIKVKFFMDK